MYLPTYTREKKITSTEVDISLHILDLIQQPYLLSHQDSQPDRYIRSSRQQLLKTKFTRAPIGFPSPIGFGKCHWFQIPIPPLVLTK